jgi:hypothetical protein
VTGGTTVDDATINPAGTDMIVAQDDGTLACSYAIEHVFLCELKVTLHYSIRRRRYRMDFNLYGFGVADDVRFRTEHDTSDKC